MFDKIAEDINNKVNEKLAYVHGILSNTNEKLDIENKVNEKLAMIRMKQLPPSSNITTNKIKNFFRLNSNPNGIFSSIKDVRMPSIGQRMRDSKYVNEHLRGLTFNNLRRGRGYEDHSGTIDNLTAYLRAGMNANL